MMRFAWVLGVLLFFCVAPQAGAQEAVSRSPAFVDEMDGLAVLEHALGRAESHETGRAEGVLGRLPAELQRTLSARVASLLEQAATAGSFTGWILLLAFALLYGLLHGILPGHRKALLISYFLAEDATPAQGVIAAVSFALLHTLVAVGLAWGGYALWQSAPAETVGSISFWMRVAGSAGMLALGGFLLTIRIREFVRTRGEWHDQKLISKLQPLDSRIDPDNEDPAVHLAVAHARRLRRRRRSEAPLLPLVIVASIVPCPAAALLLWFAFAAGAAGAGAAAVAMMFAGIAATLSVLAVIVIIAKERVVDMLGGPAAHYAHLGIEIAGGVIMVGYGLVLLL
jgi:ABC-type nickel/cobalt efflux system permease component RcnA